MQSRSRSLNREGKTIAFVPTMGFLHEGHLALMREAKKRADIVVTSIFVNPTQFAPNEDFDAYPRDTERDLKLAKQTGVDIVFMPDKQDLYPDGYETFVQLETLPGFLCGLSRPIFFRGVATVVTKLFHIVRPTTAVFGEKDYQQLVIIRKMVSDLNFGIDIVGVPTIREADGLAMSSRNAYLRPSQREAALSLFKSLEMAQSRIEIGESSAGKIIEDAKAMILSHAETEIDYISIFDPETLSAIEEINGPARMALAVKVGSTRLIDNMQIR